MKVFGKHGAPPKYKTPEDLQKKIEDYFDHGMNTRTVFVGKDKTPTEVPVPTITGLCLFLGFESRQSFYDQEKRKGFSYTIKKTRQMMESKYEEMLYAGNVAGAIFALKNFGWKDKQEIEQKNDNKNKMVIEWIDPEKIKEDKGLQNTNE